MKFKIFIVLIAVMMSIGCKNNQESEVKEVEAAIDLFRKTMLSPDYNTFDKLTSEDLSYGHSSGLVEDKEACIQSMVTGKYGFSTLEFPDQTIKISKDIAIVRNTFIADTKDKGMPPGKSHVKVLMVWRKENGHWLMLARLATKVPPPVAN